jgi:hypothetical protein
VPLDVYFEASMRPSQDQVRFEPHWPTGVLACTLQRRWSDAQSPPRLPVQFTPANCSAGVSSFVTGASLLYSSFGLFNRKTLRGWGMAAPAPLCR